MVEKILIQDCYCKCMVDVAKVLIELGKKRGLNFYGTNCLDSRVKSVYIDKCTHQIITSQRDDEEYYKSNYKLLSIEDFIKLLLPTPKPFTQYTVNCFSKETSELLFKLIKERNRPIWRCTDTFEEQWNYKFTFGFCDTGKVHLWCFGLGENLVSLEEGIKRLLVEGQ